MQTTQIQCGGCGKSTLAARPTCQYCGVPTAAPKKCPKCSRDVLANRTVCSYCGTNLAGQATQISSVPVSSMSPGTPATPRPSAAPTRPAVVPRATSGGSWFATYELPIDVTLFILALPIALLAVASSFVIGMLAKMRG